MNGRLRISNGCVDKYKYMTVSTSANFLTIKNFYIKWGGGDLTKSRENEILYLEGREA